MFSPTVSPPLTLLPGQRPGLQLVVLGDQPVGSLAEARLVVGGPPVVQVALAVVLRPLVVEAVTDLVTDDGPDAAVVERRVGVRVEERRLQDRGGEADLVGARVVVGVDVLRVHQPLVAVDRAAELAELPVGLEGALPRRTLPSRSPRSMSDRRVVAPPRRVADLGPEDLELVERLAARLRAHPVEGRRCCGGRPRPGWPPARPSAASPRAGSAARRTARRSPRRGTACDDRDPALPAVALHLGAGQGARVEVEVLGDDRRG